MKISQGFYEEKDSVTERSRGASSQTPNPPVDKTYPTSYEEVSSRIAERERVVSRLRANQDDLYIMVYPPEDLPLVCTPFLDNEQVVIAPAGHWAVGRAVELEALTGERFILREPGSGSRRTIDTYLALTGIRLDVKLSVNSNEAIRDLVATGVGLAVLSRHALPADPAVAGVCVLDVEGFPLRKPWLVVHLRSKPLSLPARAFLAHLLTAGPGASAAP
jgi:DNA-binding transcriptional LysR family regulator